ncbi:MAG TPA: hypothetical protein VES20_19850 [Bryobacteraceae bacterium]|nr:hypothetical protein [Bryobacteraceae bacterium]
MTIWPGASSPDDLLSSSEGALISVRVAVDPRRLEDLLECLAALPFPVNPEIFHGLPTLVEFPAWQDWLPVVKRALSASGFPLQSVSTRSMLETLSAS